MKNIENNIIIFKEKHGDRYFYIPTFDDLCKVALKVFKERVEDGYWYDDDDLEDKKLHNAALKDIKGDIVLKFLKTRKDYEYENFDIIQTEEY